LILSFAGTDYFTVVHCCLEIALIISSTGYLDQGTDRSLAALKRRVRDNTVRFPHLAQYFGFLPQPKNPMECV
jgi:hypothetical protein